MTIQGVSYRPITPIPKRIGSSINLFSHLCFYCIERRSGTADARRSRGNLNREGNTRPGVGITPTPHHAASCRGFVVESSWFNRLLSHPHIPPWRGRGIGEKPPPSGRSSHPCPLGIRNHQMPDTCVDERNYVQMMRQRCFLQWTEHARHDRSRSWRNGFKPHWSINIINE